MVVYAITFGDSNCEGCRKWVSNIATILLVPCSRKTNNNPPWHWRIQVPKNFWYKMYHDRLWASAVLDVMSPSHLFRVSHDVAGFLDTCYAPFRTLSFVRRQPIICRRGLLITSTWKPSREWKKTRKVSGSRTSAWSFQHIKWSMAKFDQGLKLDSSKTDHWAWRNLSSFVWVLDVALGKCM